jgi:glycosyltransferase involved in cell wall biosynthesis
MRILILSQWFEPEPTFKGLPFARELAARGHDVEVLTGFPNYPGGKIYPGYRIRPWVREQIEGISILRVALYPSHDKSAFGRVLNYTSFAISAALIGTALIRKPDVVYVYHPPATIGFAATVIGFFRKVPFVYDIQDLWPDTVALSGMMSSPAALTLLGKWCKFVYRRARHIVVLSPGFKHQLVRRGVPLEKVDVIYNWCDEAAMRRSTDAAEARKRLGVNGDFAVMFAGTMGQGQALDTVLSAAEICVRTGVRAQFLFVGGGVDRERLEEKSRRMSLPNVRFYPLQRMGDMANLLAGADALLVHLRDEPLFRITIPSKTQAYLAAGKPIIMGVRGDAAELVRRSGAGVVCEPENAESLVKAVTHLARLDAAERLALGDAGRRLYDQELSLRIGVSKFEQIFRKVVDPTH